MKPNLGFNGRNRGRVLRGTAKLPQQPDEPELPSGNGVLDRFRRLKWNELVRQGDFVANAGRKLEPWEGLNGFRADSYLKPIYRKWGCQSNEDKNTR